MHTKLTRAAATLLLWAVPTTVLANVVIAVESPAIAGLGTQIRVEGLAAGAFAHVSVATPSGEEILFPVTADQNGEVREELRGEEMERAGTYTVTAEKQGQRIAGPHPFDVLPDSLDIRRSSIEALQSRIDPDGRDAAEIRVLLTDRFGNPLPGRPVTLIASQTSASVTGLARQTDARGEIRFLVSTREAGTISLRALDLLSGNALAASAEVHAGAEPAVGGRIYDPAPRDNPPSRSIFQPRFYYAQTTAAFDVIDHFEIDAPDRLPAGEEAPRIVVRAADRGGRTVEDYVGTVVFSSTDPNATLPNFGRYEFRDRDLGQKEFPLVLKLEQGGRQTFRVEDANDPRIAGEAVIMVEGSVHTAAPIVVTSHKTGDTVKTTRITIEGKGPRFANLIVMGGLQDTPGATDKDGNFSIPVELNPAKREFTIRVRDDAGRNDSGPIDLVFDNEVPIVGTVTFSPERPQSGDKVLIVVQSEPSLASVTMQLSPTIAESLTLAENPTASGSYQAFFLAPDEGAFQPVVTATDRAGNTTDVRTVFTVGTTALPIVKNVRGQARMGSAALEWDPVTDAIDGYRVYVGERPDDYLYTLDTGSTTTKATVAGLTPGRTYMFAVTAVQGKKESAEKSDPVKVEIPGLALTVKAGDGKLLLEWAAPKVSLRSYTLEYGVQPGVYTERRTIAAKKADDGLPQAATVPDLLNGVTYHLRLVPVTVTGDALTDLAATGEGTPQGGAGFTPAPGDPIPFDPKKVALEHAPATTTTGLPAPVWLSAGLLAIILCAWQWRRRAMLRQTAMFLASIQSHYGSGKR